MRTNAMARMKDLYTSSLRWEEYLPGTLLALAFLIRILHALMGRSIEMEIWSDMNGYVSIANDILRGDWEDPFNFFQSIGYPILIAYFKHVTIHWSLYLALFQGILSFLTVLIMYKMTSEFFGKKVGLITLAISTFYLPWILAIGYALPETIFTFLLTVCGWYTYKLITSHNRIVLYSLGWIISFVLALWMKGTHVFFGPFFVLALIYQKRMKAILPVMIIASGMALSMALHGLLTYKTIGKVQFSASASGLNFVEGKCPSKINTDNLGYSWQSPLFYQLHLDRQKDWPIPFWESKYYLKEGIQCIKENPFVLILSLESIPYLFFGNNLWPFNQKSYADPVRFFELLLSMFFIVGLFSYARGAFFKAISIQEFFVWCLPILSIFFCVYVFKSEVRYRIPFDVWLIPVAVVGWISFTRSTFVKGTETH